jgi:DNA-3-methyladenine glycosylase I
MATRRLPSTSAARFRAVTDRLIVGDDGRTRCWWCGTDPLYVAYHDDDWGRPVTDERELFEKLVLDGAQAGLAWITILRKREGYRQAFEGFDPAVVAGYGDEDVARLLADPGIVRNRQKVAAAIGNARALLAMHEAGETLRDLVWAHQPPPRRRPLRPGDELPATSPEAVALSKALVQRGWKFVGPTIVYAFMQAVGVVDDHIAGCWRAA